MSVLAQDVCPTCFCLGAFLGTLVLGPLGDTLGRKPLFVFSTAVISICGMLTAISTNYIIMMVFQFGVGFGLGGVVIPFDAIAEFIPNEQRGARLPVYSDAFPFHF